MPLTGSSAVFQCKPLTVRSNIRLAWMGRNELPLPPQAFTSYIVPADILPNLRYLAGKVQDVELVLFECG